MSTVNSTTCLSTVIDEPICFQSSYEPVYYFPRAQLVEGIQDAYITMAAPVIAYWVLSLFFHYLDTCSWKWLEAYRIHPSAEVQSKNLVSRSSVVIAVIFQHIIQTVLGLWWLSSEQHAITTDHSAPIRQIALTIRPLLRLVGVADVQRLRQVAEFAYWWAMPALQMFLAMFIIDSWQYFLHRAMHVNKFLYRQLHSWHHRLYVPYAFGALYNHPLEGFLLDTLGTAMAESLTAMTTRQSMILFTISTLKTVDDHCGYSFPWDPLQIASGNNADYHDIHHQVIGIKSNFSQPFFVHWDTLLGTRMTREDIRLRREGKKNKTQ
ncbi:sphingosine hydroxylase [Coprinopsis marcescibilis]|uniref:Sphingosine hydroxylase n=1 Tax=Coprinopsis marcescibilis TaxID=230819 RepID=A0A5C3KEC7_COPMA|nr:sphingosine hydroxylase [Coprinopsis marcescibilis]